MALELGRLADELRAVRDFEIEAREEREGR